MFSDQLGLYFKWYIKTSFGLSVMLTDNLNENEVQLVKRLIWFVRVTNLAFFLLNITLILTKVIHNIWIVLSLLVLTFLVLFIVFYLVFNKDDLSLALLNKVSR
ncbi:MAG: hypothetical protein PHP11_07855 [Erysipelotrichaceae bacterium]|nr:hypothetical protein [Erysipelotrichaceae bacterium]